MKTKKTFTIYYRDTQKTKRLKPSMFVREVGSHRAQHLSRLQTGDRYDFLEKVIIRTN